MGGGGEGGGGGGGGGLRCVSSEPVEIRMGVLPGNPWQQLLLSHFPAQGGLFLIVKPRPVGMFETLRRLRMRRILLRRLCSDIFDHLSAAGFWSTLKECL